MTDKQSKLGGPFYKVKNKKKKKQSAPSDDCLAKRGTSVNK